jgi:hypothetical protein
MKRFYYESPIAKILLAFSNCIAITIGPFVFLKISQKKTSQQVRNHETCHICQWMEFVWITGLTIFMLQMLFGISLWWHLLSLTSFYIWYVIEWFFKLLIYRNFQIAYEMVSLEIEAYLNEADDDYIENRPIFTGWTKHI